MIEHIDTINVLHRQIEAILDLMQCTSEECTDIKSIKTASEMAQTMLDELMNEVDKIDKEWREKDEN